MALTTHPDFRFKFYLHDVMDLPIEVRPVVLVKPMNEHELARWRELCQEIAACPADEEGNRRCFELWLLAVKLGVTGWRNFTTAEGKPAAFTDDNLMELLPDVHKFELLYNYPQTQHLTRVTAKN